MSSSSSSSTNPEENRGGETERGNCSPPLNGCSSSSIDKEEELSSPPKIVCEFCATAFASRNALFQHLRSVHASSSSLEEGSGEIPLAPSILQKRTRQRARAEAALARRGRSGRTMQHQQHALWLGDVPLWWTRPTQQYQRLRLLLRAHLPRSVALPWIKKVQRKAYRRPLTLEATTTATTDEKDPYLGYAIVVFRDQEECDLVLQQVHGREITVDSVFDDALRQHHAVAADEEPPPFCLQVRPYQGGGGSGNVDSASSRAIPTLVGSGGGPDPPLIERWRPLSTAELWRRVALMQPDGDSSDPATRILENETPDVAATASATATMEEQVQLEHARALHAAVQVYQNVPPVERRHAGRPLPAHLYEALWSELRSLRWAVPNHRAGLTAERYLVLYTKCRRSNSKNSSNSAAAATDYEGLRAACAAVMAWADPAFCYSGLAVTKNFCGSPHIDDRDVTEQYAVSVGDFVGGGELCVDGGVVQCDDDCMDTTNDEVDVECNVDDCNEDCDADAPRPTHPRHRPLLHVWTTQGRIARVDGRRVHWVRRWASGDRYSLIYFNTRLGDVAGAS